MDPQPNTLNTAHCGAVSFQAEFELTSTKMP